MNTSEFRRPAPLRRGWMFVPGMEGKRQQVAMASGADVVVADLEEFTAPADRPAARLRIVQMLGDCRRHRVVGGVRVNKLAEDGYEDLVAVMEGRPDLIFLPHVESVEHIEALDRAIADCEMKWGYPPGATEIVPTIESARGLLALGAILRASPRIKACMLAVEDLAANLGAERGPDGIELLHARERFLIECVAAECVAIDCPCTFRAPDALALDLALSRRLGFRAKCVVYPEHVAALNRSLTPSEEDVRAAHEVVVRYQAQIQAGAAYSGEWIDAPVFNNARRLLECHRVLADYDAQQGASPS